MTSYQWNTVSVDFGVLTDAFYGDDGKQLEFLENVPLPSCRSKQDMALGNSSVRIIEKDIYRAINASDAAVIPKGYTVDPANFARIRKGAPVIIDSVITGKTTWLPQHVFALTTIAPFNDPLNFLTDYYLSGQQGSQEPIPFRIYVPGPVAGIYLTYMPGQGFFNHAWAIDTIPTGFARNAIGQPTVPEDEMLINGDYEILLRDDGTVFVFDDERFTGSGNVMIRHLELNDPSNAFKDWDHRARVLINLNGGGDTDYYIAMGIPSSSWSLDVDNYYKKHVTAPMSTYGSAGDSIDIRAFVEAKNPSTGIWQQRASIMPHVDIQAFSHPAAYDTPVLDGSPPFLPGAIPV